MKYGPQTPAVETLLTRITALTQEEAEALAEAQAAVRHADWETDWEAAWDAAQEAAWGADRGAARHAAWFAAREASSDEAWHASWGAIGDAICVLVALDLIDETTTWNQQAFDTLTQPWRSAIGPLPNKATP